MQYNFNNQYVGRGLFENFEFIIQDLDASSKFQILEGLNGSAHTHTHARPTHTVRLPDYNQC